MTFGKLIDLFPEAVEEMAGLARQSFGEQHQGCLAIHLSFLLRELLAQAQVRARILQQPITPLGGGRAPGAVKSLDLRTVETVRNDRSRQGFAARTIRAGQRNQNLHRCLRGDVPDTDLVLDRHAQRTHQAKPTRDPTQTFEETTGKLRLAPAKAMLQLRQQPTLLQRTQTTAIGKMRLKHKRFALPKLPDHRLHRVRAQLLEGRDPLMAVNHNVTALRIRSRHHHDRMLLAVLLKR